MQGSSRHGPSRPDRRRSHDSGPRGQSRPGPRQARPGRDAGGTGRHLGGRPQSAPPAAPGSIDPGRVAGLIGPVLGAAGLDLESVRVATVGRRLLLRVVVDADGGVSLDDLADVSRDVGSVLDAGGVMGEVPYTLEVSSPGVDRPLTEPRHWRRAVGRLVDATLAAAPGSASRTGRAGRPVTVRGRVIVATEDGVTLEVDGAQRTFGYHDLGPGTVQVEFGRVAEAPGPDGGKLDGH